MEFSAQFERDEVWNHHSRLQNLEANESSDLATIKATLNWFYDQGQYREFLELASNLRYFYYTRGYWELERDLDNRRLEVAKQLEDEFQQFDALLYRLNVACKQENSREVEDSLPELNRLWNSMQQKHADLPDLKRIEYYHVRALTGQMLGKLGKYNAWKEECLKFWQENVDWLEAHLSEAVNSEKRWNSLKFHYNVNLRYLANHYFELEKWVEARKLFEKALLDSQSQCFERGRVLVMLKLAALNIQEEDFGEALKTLDEITGSVSDLEDALASGQLNLLKGDARFAIGDPIEALIFYRKSRVYYDLLENQQCLERVESKIGEATEEAKKLSNA